MGMIAIVVGGSFVASAREFSAIDHGHAHAVAQAMEWLSRDVLPAAIQLDHEIHADGEKPVKGFFKPPALK